MWWAVLRCCAVSSVVCCGVLPVLHHMLPCACQVLLQCWPSPPLPFAALCRIYLGIWHVTSSCPCCPLPLPMSVPHWLLLLTCRSHRSPPRTHQGRRSRTSSSSSSRSPAGARVQGWEPGVASLEEKAMHYAKLASHWGRQAQQWGQQWGQQEPEGSLMGRAQEGIAAALREGSGRGHTT